MLLRKIIGFENVANMDAYIMALPMKIKDGTGGPLRIVAWTQGED